MLNRLGDSHIESARAKTIAKGILRNAATTEQDHLVLLAVNADDGALDSHVTHTMTEMDMHLAHFSSIQNLNWPIMKVIVYVFCSRRGDVSEFVGGRSCNWETRLVVKGEENNNNTKQLTDDFVLGTAESHLSRSCRHYVLV